MPVTPHYSTLFSCLYDEAEPIGRLGRGVHYSIFRSVEWRNVIGVLNSEAEIHDFAVIWDQDHDARVIPVIQRLYLNGLLYPIQFAGERKGTLTILLAAKFWWDVTVDTDDYIDQVRSTVASALQEDAWTVVVGEFDRAPCWPAHQTDVHDIIPEPEHKVVTYLRNIDTLWSLGTKPFPHPHTSGYATWSKEKL